MSARGHALILSSLENLALTVVRTLSEKGYEVTVAGAGSAASLRFSRHCLAFLALAQTGAEMAAAPEPALELAARAARSRGVDLVVPVDVPGGLFAAALKSRLTGPAYFPSPSPEILRMLDDKWAFYGFLQSRDLPTPRTVLVRDGAREVELAPPLILKPLSEAGGKGVSVARDPGELASLLAEPGRIYPAIAQEYIDGEEVSLSFLADRGKLLAWSIHLHAGAGEKVYIQDERVVAMGRSIAEATAYTGLANVDMRYDHGRGRVRVIECNPRFWGTFKYTLGLGVDYLERGIAMAYGRPQPPFTGAPVGAVPGLAAAVRLALRGQPVPKRSLPYLRQKLADPLPELRHALGLLLGRGPEGP